MIEISVTKEFLRRYKDLPSVVKKKAEKQERLFRSNPFHSSLHTEKLAPKAQEVWSFRVDIKYRIIFRFTSGEKALFLTVGHHSFVFEYFAKVSKWRPQCVKNPRKWMQTMRFYRNWGGAPTIF